MIISNFFVNGLFLITFLTFAFYIFNRKKFEKSDESNHKIRITNRTGTICYVIMIIEVFILTVVLATNNWQSISAKLGLS